MRFSNFVKFTGPEARGPGKGVPENFTKSDISTVVLNLIGFKNSEAQRPKSEYIKN